jgi:hypothetical protein
MWEGGIKNGQKDSDVFYGWPLIENTCLTRFETKSGLSFQYLEIRFQNLWLKETCLIRRSTMEKKFARDFSFGEPEDFEPYWIKKWSITSALWDFISKSMIKRYLLSQKKVNSGRIVTAELHFPLFAKAIIENKQ